MAIYMTHPDHGTHICYSQSEVDSCVKNGWSLREEKKPEAAAPEVKQKRKYTRRVTNDHRV